MPWGSDLYFSPVANSRLFGDRIPCKFGRISSNASAASSSPALFREWTAYVCPLLDAQLCLACSMMGSNRDYLTSRGNCSSCHCVLFHQKGIILCRVKTPIRELITIAAMCSHGTASRLANPQVHSPKYDPFVGTLGMMTVFFLQRVDQSPRNAAFPCLIAMIHNVDSEIVNPIKDLHVLFSPGGLSSVSSAHALVCCVL